MPPKKQGGGGAPPKKPPQLQAGNTQKATSTTTADASKNAASSNKKGPSSSSSSSSPSPLPSSQQHQQHGKSRAPPTAPASPTASSPAPSSSDKIDVRTLVAGKSWTGKLPQTLLHEHCQRSGWEKPIYDSKPEGKNHVGIVTLSCRNLKTNELESVTFRPPLTALDGKSLLNTRRPTPIEAKHVAATYVLHRVSNMKNVHLALPPTHRGYWSAFEEIRKGEAKRGLTWKYEADPFVAQKEHEAERKEREKKRAAEAEKRAAGGLIVEVRADQDKGWAKMPIVDMGTERRKEVEGLIRKYHVWNSPGKRMASRAWEDTLAEMASLGFRRAHVVEALDSARDREETLEWLLIHVPEDDLPSRFLPENYAAGMTLGAGENLGLEYMARRLSSAGYSIDLCREALLKNSSDEWRAAEALQQILLHGKQTAPEGAIEEPMISFHDPGEVDGPWLEEMQSLEAIYGLERFTSVSATVCKILLLPQEEESPLLSEKIFLQIRRPTFYEGCDCYPNAIPTFTILAEGDPQLPAYVRLSIIRQLSEEAEQIKGEQMIFSLVDWLEEEIADIVEFPGPLRDITTAVTGSDERQQMPGYSEGKWRRKPRLSPVDWTPETKESMKIFSDYQQRMRTPQQATMLRVRQGLPAWYAQDEVIATLRDSRVVIISGETGSGKSTQIVQFILDDMIDRKLGAAANIICTQPRRISALALADRVSDERCSRLGREVGYAIRGESKLTPGVTKITFVTTGVLLRRIQMGDQLEDVSHIVIDEVHERSLDTDFLLILVKRMIKAREDLSIILMSATLDADTFATYFANTSVAQVNVPGRTFPVTDHYLDQVIELTGFTGGTRLVPVAEPSTASIIRGVSDRINYNLIASTVKYIDENLGSEDGAVLIFLPGTMEIQRCLDAIKAMPGGAQRYHGIPLHASMQPSEQRRAFPRAPGGKRKVIAATNVAETSITIDDVVAVIDSGKVKETSYDPQSNIVRLAETWVSKAAAKQRRGRAGRVREGNCYKLYTRSSEENHMPDRPVPELLRVPLEQACLGVRAMGIRDVRTFLNSALTPPESLAIESALITLGQMGALVNDDLTALGKHMSLIPADLRCSKLMVYGALFRCLEPCVAIASLLTTRSPFVNPGPDRRDAVKAVRSAFARDQGDLIGDYRVCAEFWRLRECLPFPELKVWCETNFISLPTMLDITSNRIQYFNSLFDAGLIPKSTNGLSCPESFNSEAGNMHILRALIAAAFAPQIARIQLPDQKYSSSITGSVAIDPEARAIKYFNSDNSRVFIHPSSTLFAAQSYSHGTAWLAYFAKMMTAKVMIRECSPVNAYTLLLLGGKVEVDTLGRGITVDGWIRMRGWGRIGTLVGRLRVLLDEALEKMVEEPEMATKEGRARDVIEVVKKLVERNGM